MIDDDVTAILTKTREYYNFIKSRLEKQIRERINSFKAGGFGHVKYNRFVFDYC